MIHSTRVVPKGCNSMTGSKSPYSKGHFVRLFYHIFDRRVVVPRTC